MVLALSAAIATAWREAVRADRLEVDRDALATRLRDAYVPLERYQDAAHARNQLETALRDGFLPALQDATVANRESLHLIQAFQQEQATLNHIRLGT
jgi:hypothetical protein